MKVGFYEKDITPPLGCYMAGNYREQRGMDISEPLYARACVVNSGENTVAMVSIDACIYPADMHDRVCGRIKEYTGIEPENVLLTITHTHKGASLTSNPEYECYRDEPYVDVVYRLIADCVILAYKRMNETKAYFGKGYADDIAFNRNFIMKDGTYRTHSTGDNPNVLSTLSGIDPDVPCLWFKDDNGKTVGAVVSYACHPNSVGGMVYSGDYVYYLSTKLKEKYGSDFVTVFFAGTCADINWQNPKLTDMPSDLHIIMGHKLADEVVNAINNSEEVVGDKISSVKEIISLPKREYSKESVMADAAEFAKMKHPFAARNILYYFATNKTDTAEVYIQCIKIGDMCIYAYPGEIYVDFGLDLKSRSQYSKTIVASLSNSPLGYVPIRKAFEPQSKLYETKLCEHACLAQEAGYILTDKLLELSSLK